MSSDLASNLFFVVGTGRCGTTLFCAMLNSHPHLYVPPYETNFFQRCDPLDPPFGGDPLPQDQIENYLSEVFKPEAWTKGGFDIDLRREDVERDICSGDRSARSIFLALMEAIRRRSGKPRVGEKTAWHSRRVPRILEVIPEAKFIHLYRDPRDVVASMLHSSSFPGTTRVHARLWVKIVSEHLRLVQELPEIKYLPLQYETLVRYPERELRRVCAFLGEDFVPEMLYFQDAARRAFLGKIPVMYSLTTTPLTTGTIGRYHQRLTRRQVGEVERIAGRLMRKLGYERTISASAYRPDWMLLDAAEYLCHKTARWLAKRSSVRTAAPLRS